MGITADGYETTPKETIKTEVQEIFTNALGDDLDLSDETPQGNLINGLTDLLHQIDMHRQSDFYSRDLYKAVGTQLDIIGRELGIPRKESIPTQILVNLQGAINYKIDAGTLAHIVSNSSEIFEFTNDVEITSSDIQVTLTASNGKIYDDLVVGQQLQTQEYTPQIYNISIVSIVYGQQAESDYSYRLRLLDAKSSTTDEVAHFTLALQNIPNVLSAYVEPNNTLETSPSGIPSHAVEIVVLGGSEADIGEVIMDNIFATPTYNDPSLGEEIQVEDYNGHIQTFYITRPAMRNIYVSIEYENKADHMLTTDEINDIIAKVTEFINSIHMNKTLYVSDIYNIAIQDYSRIYAIKSLTIQTDGDTPGTKVDIENSYTCSSREYLHLDSIEFEEAE